MSDAEGEAAETITWLDFANACDYLSDEHHEELHGRYGAVRGGLIKMVKNPDSWCGPSSLREPTIGYSPDPED